MLIDSSESKYQLGVPQMDETHREFMELVNQLDSADKPAFMELFPLLVEHTEAHFDSEQVLMRSTAFPAIREHTDEHQRILGQMHRLADKVAGGSIAMARAFVREQLPDWFELHAATMDSALAAHVKYHSQTVSFTSTTMH